MLPHQKQLSDYNFQQSRIHSYPFLCDISQKISGK